MSEDCHESGACSGHAKQVYKDADYYPTRYLGGSEPEHRYEGCFYPPVEPVWSVLKGSRRPTVGDLLAWVKTTR